MTKTEIIAKLTFDLETRGRSIETIKEYTSKFRLFQDYYLLVSKEFSTPLHKKSIAQFGETWYPLLCQPTKE